MLSFETSAKTGQQLKEAVDAIIVVIEKYVAEGVYEGTPSPGPQQFLEPEKQCPC
jgi:hypothetical protein